MQRDDSDTTEEPVTTQASDASGEEYDADPPDFEQPAYPTFSAATPAEPMAVPEATQPEEPLLSMPLRVAAGTVAGLISAQGVARFAEIVLEAAGLIPDQHVPLLVALAAGVLFVLPIAASALLASRGTRYALVVGGVLALVVAVLGRVGMTDLTAVLFS